MNNSETSGPIDPRRWDERLADALADFCKNSPRKAALAGLALVGLLVLDWRYPLCALYIAWLRFQPTPALLFGAGLGAVGMLARIA